MNDEPSSQDCPSEFAELVRNYVRPLPEKFQTLWTHREGIVELRRKGASLRTITQLLKQVGVSVSHDTMARFCRDVIDATEPRQKVRPKRVRISSEPPRKDSSASSQTLFSIDDQPRVRDLLQQRRNENESSDAPNRTPRSGRSDRGGPRIADPKNV